MSQSLASALREARRARGLTQVELAVLAGCSPSTIHRIESGRGEPSERVLRALRRKLEADLAPTEAA